VGEGPATNLAVQFEAPGFKGARSKTETPPCVAGRTMDYSLPHHPNSKLEQFAYR
jgi:tRNA U34 5-carboxymethylaminomethyl modifying enzyme MnmG/GidA